MKKFALIGAAGYIAPRHMKAIKETGNRLIAALDKHDSVGILDSYFPDSTFFTEFERFDRHIEKLRRKNQEAIDYVSICSPNYLHDAHIRFAFRSGADAICEKPLVINPWNVEGLKEIENLTGRKAYNILQLRCHETIKELKSYIDNYKQNKIYDIDLAYITARGKWYTQSWKGDEQKSGGVAANIGIHFFDMLQWIFGSKTKLTVNISTPTKMAGFLELKKANVRWFLSIDHDDLPVACKEKNQRTFRQIKISGKEMEFSEGFTDLHTISYQEIINGRGYGIDDARPAIEISYEARNAKPIGLYGEYHPYIQEITYE